MKAQVGDWLVIKGLTVDRPERHGLITEVHSTDGSPPLRGPLARRRPCGHGLSGAGRDRRHGCRATRRGPAGGEAFRIDSGGSQASHQEGLVSRF